MVYFTWWVLVCLAGCWCGVMVQCERLRKESREGKNAFLPRHERVRSDTVMTVELQESGLTWTYSAKSAENAQSKTRMCGPDSVNDRGVDMLCLKNYCVQRTPSHFPDAALLLREGQPEVI